MYIMMNTRYGLGYGWWLPGYKNLYPSSAKVVRWHSCKHFVAKFALTLPSPCQYKPILPLSTISANSIGSLPKNAFWLVKSIISSLLNHFLFSFWNELLNWATLLPWSLICTLFSTTIKCPSRWMIFLGQSFTMRACKNEYMKHNNGIYI